MKTHHIGKLAFAEIFSWLLALRSRAYCPISHYAVAAVGRALDSTGQDIYLAGVNVENADHRLSTHAEEGVLAALVTALGPSARLQEIWAVAAPDHLRSGDDDVLAKIIPSYCGKCRQQMAGLAVGAEMKLHGISLDGQVDTMTLAQALKGYMTLENIEASSHHLISGVSIFDSQKMFQRGDVDIKQWLGQLQACDPITQHGRCSILSFNSDAHVAGVDIEDAAFLSISAYQAALAIAAVQGVDVSSDTVQNIHTKGGLSQKLRASDLQVLEMVLREETRQSFL